jgi:predicted RNA-binding Zn-ribbon protein involved in translation (DUF1610 family)
LNKDNVKKEEPVDLFSAIQEIKQKAVIFMCPDCNSELIRDATWRVKNPHGGTGYWCCTCHKTHDSSVERLEPMPEPKRSFMGDTGEIRDPNVSTNVFFETISENKGLAEPIDEYKEIMDRFEPNEEERLRNMGATITHSEITLTDAMGHNRTLVRRRDPIGPSGSNSSRREY